MRSFRILLAALLVCLLIPGMVLAQSADVSPLTPLAMAGSAAGEALPLYCGPTQGFYRQGEQTLDTGSPYVLFGQYDCWAMVAQGTPEAFGPVGWVEAGLIADLPDEPLLAFEDGFAAMVEDTAALTDCPLAADPFAGWEMTLAPGTPIIVLAQLGDWLYVQAEPGDCPIRAFIPANTVF